MHETREGVLTESGRVVDRLRSYPLARLDGVIAMLEQRVGDLASLVAAAEGHGHEELPPIPRTAWGDVVAVQVADCLAWADGASDERVEEVLAAAAGILVEIRRSI